MLELLRVGLSIKEGRQSVDFRQQFSQRVASVVGFRRQRINRGTPLLKRRATSIPLRDYSRRGIHIRLEQQLGNSDQKRMLMDRVKFLLLSQWCEVVRLSPCF